MLCWLFMLIFAISLTFYSLCCSNASSKVEFFGILFNALVMPWINQSTLNVSMTTWRGFRMIYLSHTYHTWMVVKRLNFNHNSSTLPLLCDDVCCSNDGIVKHFFKCSWISTSLWGWNFFSPGEKSGRAPLWGAPVALHVCIWHIFSK